MEAAQSPETYFVARGLLAEATLYYTPALVFILLAIWGVLTIRRRLEKISKTNLEMVSLLGEIKKLLENRKT